MENPFLGPPCQGGCPSVSEDWGVVYNKNPSDYPSVAAIGGDTSPDKGRRELVRTKRSQPSRKNLYSL